jgi:hypothetical protein
MHVCCEPGAKATTALNGGVPLQEEGGVRHLLGAGAERADGQQAHLQQRRGALGARAGRIQVTQPCVLSCPGLHLCH